MSGATDRLPPDVVDQLVHDINNLVTAAALHVSRARQVAGDVAEVLEALDGTDAALRRAGSLARQLLGAPRRDPGARGTTQVADVVRGVESLLRGVLPVCIELVVNAPPTACLVPIDPLQLERVLINLVLNARDAITGFGVITITVAEIAAGAGQAVRVQVADTGSGMPPGAGDPLAASFTTKPDGLGIGLAAVRHVLQQAGGTLSIDTSRGAGTTVTLTLPCSGVAAP